MAKLTPKPAKGEALTIDKKEIETRVEQIEKELAELEEQYQRLVVRRQQLINEQAQCKALLSLFPSEEAPQEKA